MENITLGSIAAGLALIVGIIASVKHITKEFKLIIGKEIKEVINPLSEQIKHLDVGQCKNYLVRFLSDVESGEKLDDSEIERAYEIYDHYTNDLKQNSYIHKRWNELMEEKER